MADVMEHVVVMEDADFRSFLYWASGAVLFEKLPEDLARDGLCKFRKTCNGQQVPNEELQEFAAAICKLPMDNQIPLIELIGVTIHALHDPKTEYRYQAAEFLKPFRNIKQTYLEYVADRT